MIPTILRSVMSLKDIDILTMKLSQQPGKNPLKLHFMYTSNYFVYDILLIVIKYMVNSHLSVRRILNKTSTFAHCSENKQVYGSVWTKKSPCGR